jgi:hypothetical protein
MDHTATDFKLTENGCNYCDEFLQKYPGINSREFTQIEEESNLKAFAAEVRALNTGFGNYDCLVGISGGLDSCYALHLVCKAGLKPLVVHMDNGWNSELAQHNIERMLQKLGTDYEANVLRWSEYKQLQLAFLDADVVDIELLYDQAAIATCFKFAKLHNINVIVAGTNIATEGFRMPPTWAWVNKMDARNIKDIWNKFGTGEKIQYFPFYSSFDYIEDTILGDYKWLSILDRITYSKARAEKELQEIYGYKRYPYKHYESMFTRFYQGYLLPKKFKIDKRRSHFSTLIMTGTMTRNDAISQLAASPYPSEEQEATDLAYFLKKIEWDNNDLENYLSRPGKSHLDFKSEESLLRLFRKLDFIFIIVLKILKTLKVRIFDAIFRIPVRSSSRIMITSPGEGQKWHRKIAARLLIKIFRYFN